MIDAESRVFTRLEQAVQTQYPGISVSSEYVPAPESFPAVSIEEADNSLFKLTRTLDGAEQHSAVLYIINVYSALAIGKKTQAKSIMKILDAEMMNMGFTRINCVRTQNIDDAVYRFTARYKAVISNDFQVYRR